MGQAKECTFSEVDVTIGAGYLASIAVPTVECGVVYRSNPARSRPETRHAVRQADTVIERHNFLDAGGTFNPPFRRPSMIVSTSSSDMRRLMNHRRGLLANSESLAII